MMIDNSILTLIISLRSWKVNRQMGPPLESIWLCKIFRKL